MPELVGPIQSLELASWLWLIPFFPLVGAAVNALYSSGALVTLIRAVRLGFADDDDPKPKASPRVVAMARTSARIATSSLALSVLAALAYAASLFQLPDERRFLSQPLWQLVRVGQIDVGFDLALDPLSALLVVLVAALGTWLSVKLARQATESDAAWRVFSVLGLFVFFLTLVLLADNFLLLFIGWEGVALSGLGLRGPRAPRQLPDPERVTRVRTFQRAGEAGLILGAALVFWALAGSWPTDGAFQSDLDPRISAVDVEPPPAGGATTKGKGFLTVTALPGALVYLDESRTPITDGSGMPLVTPFSRHELEGGAHAFRVAPDDRFHAAHDAKPAYVLEGGILPNYTTPRIAIGGDREVALSIIGPTLKFRELSDQLGMSGVAGPHDRRDKVEHPIRERLATRKLWGPLRVATLACLLLLVGAASKGSDLFLRRWLVSDVGAPSAPTLVHGGGMLLVGIYLMSRLWFLFALSSAARIAIEVTASGAALFFMAQVAARRRARQR
jgi:NADH-quinone oxidoreductase subunit L